MAVTLTSTGITFSDGSTQNAAAGGGTTGSHQAFNSTGIWNRPAGVGAVSVAMAAGNGGSGGNTHGWGPKSGGSGGVGAALPSTLEAVNGNMTVTVGSNGNSGNSAAYSGNSGSSGGSSSFGTITVNGGGGGTAAGYSPGSAGGSGNGPVGAITPVGTTPYVLVSW